MNDIFTARPRRSGRRKALAGGLIAALAAWYTVVPNVGADAGTATITGMVFEDLDRDGQRDTDEPGWAETGVSVYDAGGWVATGVTDASGRYEIAGLAPGEYRVRYHTVSWRDVRDDWAPTTVDGVWPESVVDVSDTARFDLGWRPIVTSETLGEPVSSAVAPSGLQVDSYTDAVDATEVVAAIESGNLRGGEQSTTTVRFGFRSDPAFCSTSVGGSPGTYRGFRATCSVDYTSWLLTRHEVLFHEYGHAWAEYHRTIVNQWGDLDPYLGARGIDPEDDRLGTSHAWSPGEMIAEDFRQLFGSDSAREPRQENTDIAPAATVEGLADWLSGRFMGSGTATTEDPSPEPSDEETAPAETDTEPSDDGTDPVAGETPTSEDDGGPVIAETSAGSTNEGSTWQAWTLVVVTLDGAPVPGVSVEGNWDGDGRHGADGPLACTTDDKGRCRLETSHPKRVSKVVHEFSAPSISVVTVEKP